jgi:hypothetical protein
MKSNHVHPLDDFLFCDIAASTLVTTLVCREITLGKRELGSSSDYWSKLVTENEGADAIGVAVSANS